MFQNNKIRGIEQFSALENFLINTQAKSVMQSIHNDPGDLVELSNPKEYSIIIKEFNAMVMGRTDLPRDEDGFYAYNDELYNWMSQNYPNMLYGGAGSAHPSLSQSKWFTCNYFMYLHTKVVYEIVHGFLYVVAGLLVGSTLRSLPVCIAAFEAALTGFLAPFLADPATNPPADAAEGVLSANSKWICGLIVSADALWDIAPADLPDFLSCSMCHKLNHSWDPRTNDVDCPHRSCIVGTNWEDNKDYPGKSEYSWVDCAHKCSTCGGKTSSEKAYFHNLCTVDQDATCAIDPQTEKPYPCSNPDKTLQAACTKRSAAVPPYNRYTNFKK